MLNESRSAKDPLLNGGSKPSLRSGLKKLGMIAAAGAVLAAASYTLSHQGSGFEGGSVLVAGGNHNPTFTPPNVPGMNMGGTVTETTPSSVLPTEKAVPQVKASH